MKMKLKVENGDYWQENDKDLIFTNIADIESAVDDFINDTQEAYTLNLLDTGYTYDDIIVDTYDTGNTLIKSECYLDFMAKNSKNFNISMGL